MATGGLPKSYRPLDREVLERFRTFWEKVWFLHECYESEIGDPGLTHPDLESDAIWFGRATWFIHTVTGRFAGGVWSHGPLRLLAMMALGNNVKAMTETAFELTGTEVKVTVRGTEVLVAPSDEIHEGYDAFEFHNVGGASAASSSQTMVRGGGNDWVVSGSMPVLTRFLETVSPAAPTVGGMLAMRLPRSATFTDLSGQLVEGLHPPQVCEMCDRLRIRAGGRPLSLTDKMAVFVLHMRARE